MSEPDHGAEDRLPELEQELLGGSRRYTRKQVAHLYESQGKLATEHPQLDDDGDGKGTAIPNAQQGDGVIAASLFLDMPRAAVAGVASEFPTCDTMSHKNSKLLAVGS